MNKQDIKEIITLMRNISSTIQDSHGSAIGYYDFNLDAIKELEKCSQQDECYFVTEIYQGFPNSVRIEHHIDNLDAGIIEVAKALGYLLRYCALRNEMCYKDYKEFIFSFICGGKKVLIGTIECILY